MCERKKQIIIIAKLCFYCFTAGMIVLGTKNMKIIAKTLDNLLKILYNG